MLRLPQNVIFSQFRRCSSQKLPARLSEKLLQSSRNRKSFPKAPKSLSLARNLAQADVSLAQFIAQVQPYISSKNLQSSTETIFVEDGDLEGTVHFLFFYSYIIYNLIYTTDYLVVLKNIQENPNKYLNLSGGILNFHSQYKIAEIFENNAKTNVAPDTNILQDFPNLVYMQWLTYFLNGQYQASKSILQDNTALICDLLIQDLRGYAKEYQKSKLTPKKVPRIFDPGSIDHLCDKLVQENGDILGPIVINQIQAYKSLALWNAGQFSDALATLATTFTFYLKHFHEEEICLQVGKHLISVFIVILRNIVEKNMKPAMKFLDVMMEKLSYKIPILPYIIATSYSTNDDLKDVVKEINAKYPSLEHLKHHSKFENCIKKADMTEESKQFFIMDFLLNLDKSKFIEVKPQFSAKLKQEMTDIQGLKQII